MPVEWNKLRSWNGSQPDAFEKLICQLASYEHSRSEGKFDRKGTPDAGVECFWRFPSSAEYGWQAKFFTSPLSPSQWKQVDSSVKRALEKHPNLCQYTICMATDRSDPRREGETSFLDHWNKRVNKWEGWATEKGMCVQFCYWGTHEIIERLLRNERRGMHLFWFNKELFTPTWFQQRLEEVIDAVGPRYTPKLNVQLPLSAAFEALSRSPNFFASFQKAYGEIGKEWSKGFLKPIEIDAPQQVENFYKQLEQIIQTAKNYDKPGIEPIDWSLMGCQLREALKYGSDIDYLLTEELHHSESCETGKRTTEEPSKREHLNHARYYLRRIEDKLMAFKAFVESDIARLASQPAMLLVGAAGTGKTHMFSDAAKHHVQTDSPAILLLGIQFTKEEPWTQIRQMLDLTCTREEFLGALESAAQTSGRRAIIFIDALNEVEDSSKWQTWLPSMLKCLKRYPWIAIAVSVRTSSEKQIIAGHLVTDKLVRCIHQGFDGTEYQAAREFFDFYKLQMPAIPLLTPELQNPLFLRCLCQGLNNRNLLTIPTGIQGITSVFDFFLDSVDEKLAKPEFLDYDPESRLVRQAIRQLASRMSQSTGYTIPRTEAIAICDKIYPHEGFKNSLFRHLLSEGVLFETNSYHDTGSHQGKIVTFSYQRLADHLIMRELISEHVKSSNPAEAFANGPLGSYFKDVMSCWVNSGWVEALAIQGPETLKKEIFELLPELKDAIPVCAAFIESLIWRAPSTILADKCIQYIKAHIAPEANLNRKFLNAILTIVPNPQHPFNADFLHDKLMKFEMADRDARWSIPLFHEFGENSAVDRLIDWAWSDTDKAHVSDESIRLLGTALVWFLTTSHRSLRDRTTKALVSLFVDRIHVLCQVIRNFIKVNDLYVSERLYSVAYGCALRSNDPDAKTSLAQFIYDLVFKDGSPPCHILLRDYARGVVEVALRDGLNLVGVEPHKIRPPYKSEWPLQIPPEEDVQEYGKLSEEMSDEQLAFRLIYFSVMEYGDFARYIIGNRLQWSKRRLGEEHKLLRKEQLDADELAFPTNLAQRWILKRVRDLGWTEDRFGRFDYDLEPGRGTTKPERMGKKYQWIAYHEFLAHLADNLEFREDSWSEEPAVYEGPWQLSLRDIDPSSLLKSTRRSKWKPNVSSWWAPVEFHAWTDEMDETQWLNRLDLLPKITSLPVVTGSEDGREWFVLECTYDWEEPTPPENDRLDLKRRHIWYMLKSYLVKSDDEKCFCDWAKDQHFMGRWMPDSHEQTNIFLGEFFWSPAFKSFNTSYYGHQSWTRGDSQSLPCKVLVTADEYLQERGYDCSIEDTISAYLPAKWIVDKMNLSWYGEEGCYSNREGQLVAQDPSARTAGRGALLMDKSLMSEFLECEGYRIVWTLLGEKSIRNSWKKGSHFPGRMELSGYMRMRDGQLIGEATAYWRTQESDLRKIERIGIR